MREPHEQQTAATARSARRPGRPAGASAAAGEEVAASGSPVTRRAGPGAAAAATCAACAVEHLAHAAHQRVHAARQPRSSGSAARRQIHEAAGLERLGLREHAIERRAASVRTAAVETAIAIRPTSSSQPRCAAVDAHRRRAPTPTAPSTRSGRAARQPSVTSAGHAGADIGSSAGEPARHAPIPVAARTRARTACGRRRRAARCGGSVRCRTARSARVPSIRRSPFCCDSASASMAAASALRTRICSCSACRVFQTLTAMLPPMASTHRRDEHQQDLPAHRHGAFSVGESLEALRTRAWPARLASATAGPAGRRR